MPSQSATLRLSALLQLCTYSRGLASVVHLWQLLDGTQKGARGILGLLDFLGDGPLLGGSLQTFASVERCGRERRGANVRAVGEGEQLVEV
eukprot:5899936-Pleurochrysis_carterae.AAC.1